MAKEKTKELELLKTRIGSIIGKYNGEVRTFDIYYGNGCLPFINGKMMHLSQDEYQKKLKAFFESPEGQEYIVPPTSQILSDMQLVYDNDKLGLYTESKPEDSVPEEENKTEPEESKSEENKEPEPQPLPAKEESKGKQPVLEGKSKGEAEPKQEKSAEDELLEDLYDSDDDFESEKPKMQKAEAAPLSQKAQEVAKPKAEESPKPKAEEKTLTLEDIIEQDTRSKQQNQTATVQTQPQTQVIPPQTQPVMPNPTINADLLKAETARLEAELAEVKQMNNVLSIQLDSYKQAIEKQVALSATQSVPFQQSLSVNDSKPVESKDVNKEIIKLNESLEKSNKKFKSFITIGIILNLITLLAIPLSVYLFTESNTPLNLSNGDNVEVRAIITNEGEETRYSILGTFHVENGEIVEETQMNDNN